jgi:hypothetical protein
MYVARTCRIQRYHNWVRIKIFSEKYFRGIRVDNFSLRRGGNELTAVSKRPILKTKAKKNDAEIGSGPAKQIFGNTLNKTDNIKASKDPDRKDIISDGTHQSNFDSSLRKKTSLNRMMTDF